MEPTNDENAPQDEDLLDALRSLASIDLEEVTVQGGAEQRVTLGAVDQHDQAEMATVVVQLTWGEASVRGVAQGGTAEHSLLRSAAQATLAAVDELLPVGRAELHVDRLEVMGPASPNRSPVVHCAVTFRTAAGEDLLVGSAVVRDDVIDTAVRATLDAINRRLHLLLEA